MKQVAILGSTGSIGQNALRVIRCFPGDFRICGLSTNSNITVLLKQIQEFRPDFICVSDFAAAEKIKSQLGLETKLFAGEEGLKSFVRQEVSQKILIAVTGAAALTPLLEAIDCGKEIALANKEALVMAGPLIMRKAAERKVKIIPVDSEQSAIWQCLAGETLANLRNIYLTASGGPFWDASYSRLKKVSINAVLKHPRWRMGKKISVDSATLMNKGFELLEAMFLFNCSYDKIKILIHPEALVHSMVEFVDGVVLAQLSATDMRIPIQYALFYPRRNKNTLPEIDFYKLKALHFAKPDFKKFPCLRLAYRAARELGSLPCVLNAANEICVEEFLKKRLGFMRIPEVIERVLDSHRNIAHPDLGRLKQADAWARARAHEIIGH